MSGMAIGLVTLVFVFGGALLGIFLRVFLPGHHLGGDSRDIVKLAMGLVGTMSALVLGLLISSAKTSFDTQSAELTDMSSKVVLLDRLLAHYGPETKEERDFLRGTVVRVLNQMWSNPRTVASQSDAGSPDSEVLYDEILGLPTTNDTQRAIQGQALNIVIALGQARWLMYEQRVNSVSFPLLVVLISWLTIIFISFGLFAPPNATVIASLFVSALSVSSAIFVIVETYSPYSGLIQISSAPLRVALAHLGQ